MNITGSVGKGGEAVSVYEGEDITVLPFEAQMTPGGATELMEVLGKEESIRRIKDAIVKLG